MSKKWKPYNGESDRQKDVQFEKGWRDGAAGKPRPPEDGSVTRAYFFGWLGGNSQREEND